VSDPDVEARRIDVYRRVSRSRTVRIGIVGAGMIGATLAKLWTESGHDVRIASRHPETLHGLVESLGPLASVGTPAEAVRFADVVMLTVPLRAIPDLAVISRRCWLARSSSTRAMRTRNGLGTLSFGASSAMPGDGIGMHSLTLLVPPGCVLLPRSAPRSPRWTSQNQQFADSANPAIAQAGASRRRAARSAA